ncbi:MAG: hypothetical protein C3F15_00410 [Holophagae bacterium]|nr:MAG: hypothetical protein C3F15_00410 [Holophagae bacterium]
MTAGLPASAVMTDIVHCLRPAFSPDGRRLACGGWQGEVTVFPDDGGEPLEITGLPRVQDSRGVSFVPGNDRLLTWLDGDPTIRVFSAVGEQIGSLPGEATDLLVIDEDTIATFGASVPGDTERAVRVWSLTGHSSRLVARWHPPSGFQARIEGLRPAALDPRLRYLAAGAGTEVRLVGLGGEEAGREMRLGTHQANVREIAFTRDGSRLASVDDEGGLRVWPVGSGESLRSLDAQVPTRLSRLAFDASSSRLGWASDSGALVWSLADPPDATPRLLRGPGEEPFGAVAFEPEGRWAAAGRISGSLYMWSLASPYPRVLQGHTQAALDLAFTADSRFLASCGLEGARLWPLSPDGGHERLVSLGEEYWCVGIAADATSQTLLVAAPELGAFLVQPDGTTPHKLQGVPPTTLYSTALDTRAGLAAVGVSAAFAAKEMAIHVVDLGSGATRTLQLLDHESVSIYESNVCSLGIAADGSLISGGDGGVYRWNAASGERTRVCGGDGLWGEMAASRSGRNMIAGCWDDKDHELLVVDLVTGAERRITSHGEAVTVMAMDATGERIATGDKGGAVRVGWATGEEPHLLLGHRDGVTDVEFSPDGRWLASSAGTEIFLWPLPDLSKPPLHALPHDELLAKLHSLTNLRVVRDPSSSTGWTIEVGPFPGWAEVPEWNP